MSAKTLHKWHQKIKENEKWSPIVGNSAIRRKAMDDIMEESIIYYICSKFLSKGFQFNDRMCRTIALKFWEEHPTHRLAESFKASNKWIARFKRKFGLVNRKVHYHRRPYVNFDTFAKCKSFINTVAELYQKHKEANTLQYLINVDETAWKIFNFGEITWASKGAEHVEFTSDFNEKEMVTVIAAITAEKEKYKLPLCLIKKGKTNRAAKAFDEIKQYFQINISESGWSSVSCFAHYLLWLRQEIDQRNSTTPGYSTSQEIDIILDLYASHRNAEIKKLAEKLHFKLHFIPAGFTDSLQPLDRYVFGALKSMARAEFYREYTINPEARHTIEHACEILLQCWSKLTNETLSKAWKPYSDPGNEDVNSLINRSTISINVNKDQLLTINEEMPIANRLNSTCYNQEEEEEESGDSEIYDGESNDEIIINESIRQQMKEIIVYERILAQTNGRLVKPISNIWCTCNANTTTQSIQILPGIRDCLRHFEENDMFEKDKLLEALNLCLKEYDKSERIVKTIPINECFNLMTDACDNINYVLQKLKYGLTIHGDALLSTIQLMPTVRNEVTSIKDMLNEMIGSKSYEFNKVIAMRKAPQHNYCYEESFIYGKYVFVLKEVICNTPDKHFYVYIRKGFSSEYIIVDDSSIRAASKEQIDISSTALGIYYVFEDENTAKESDIQQDVSEVTINYKDLEISDEIKEILQNIGEDTKSTHQKQNRTTSNETVYCRKDLQSITPIVRIEFPSRKEEQGLVYMKDFIAKFE